MITFDKLQELIGLLDDAPQVTEITISVPGGEQVSIKKQSRVHSHSQGIAPVYAAEDSSHEYAVPESAEFDTLPSTPGSAPAPDVRSIDANRVGIFHTSKPRIELGDKISTGQIVGFIESIKLMNEIRSEIDGKLVAQLLEDGTPVEYGQQLYSVQSAEE